MKKTNLVDKKEWLEEKIRFNKRRYEEQQQFLAALKDEFNQLQTALLDTNAELAKDAK